MAQIEQVNQANQMQTSNLFSFDPIQTTNKKEGGRSRLSRCGACDACNRQDCGECVNCADKPKFGGPGIKKQACIRRKCLNMQSREEEDDGPARKRAKFPGAGAMNTMLAAMISTASTPLQGAERRESMDSGMIPPTKTLPEGTTPADGTEAASDATYCSDVDVGEDSEDGSDTGLAISGYRLSGFPASDLPLQESAWSGNTEHLIEYLMRRKNRMDGWTCLQSELQNEHHKTIRSFGGEWSWADKSILEEEFISMNERHRREVKSFAVSVF